MRPRRYMFGNELPVELQREALGIYLDRFTGDHRPRWLDDTFTGSDRRNGPPDFPDDGAWLANVEFPIAGEGSRLRISRNPRTPRVHYVRDPIAAAGTLFTSGEAEALALRIARMAKRPVWVMVEGSGTGDLTFARPGHGVPRMWRLATPAGKLY